ncbi:MAG: hypothetical protein J0H75_10935 [Rhizobiales bacterium]|nr:hypothetical protein [Hyphomicrobiales bacterium]
MNLKKNRKITYESALERDLAYILLAHPDVEDVHDQAVAIEYVGGHHRKHSFDYIAHRKTARKTAIAVKPARRVQSSGLADDIKLIREQAPSGAADEYVIRTEAHITRVRADNARLIHRARQTRDENDVAAIAEIVATMRGAMTIASLLAVSINNGHGFYAVICLIDDGVLENVGAGPITYASLVKPINRE